MTLAGKCSSTIARHTGSPSLLVCHKRRRNETYRGPFPIASTLPTYMPSWQKCATITGSMVA